MTHTSSELIAHADAATVGAVDDGPGWDMAPHHAADAGFDARGSWLLEPDTGTGMLLYPRDWTFVERRDVTAHLRTAGWSIVPISRFLHLASDGITATSRRTLLQAGTGTALALAATVPATARAQGGPAQGGPARGEPLRIGVMTDLSGPFAGAAREAGFAMAEVALRYARVADEVAEARAGAAPEPAPAALLAA